MVTLSIATQEALRRIAASPKTSEQPLVSRVLPPKKAMNKPRALAKIINFAI